MTFWLTFAVGVVCGLVLALVVIEIAIAFGAWRPRPPSEEELEAERALMAAEKKKYGRYLLHHERESI